MSQRPTELWHREYTQSSCRERDPMSGKNDKILPIMQIM